MSLISDALKTAQRERSERISAPTAQRNLVEGFFPVSTPVREGSRSLRTYAMALGVVAVLALSGAVLLRARHSPIRVPPGPVALPLLPNQVAATAPQTPAPIISAPPPGPTAVPESDPARQPIAVGPTPSPASPLSSSGERAASSPAPASRSDARVESPAVSRVVADSAPAVSTRPPVAPMQSQPQTTGAFVGPQPQSPVRVTVEGGARKPGDLLAADALAAQQQGNFDRAQELYERAIAGTPTADVYNNYGVLLLQRGDSGAAILMYRRAVKLDPTKVEAWANLGDALDQRGIHAEATSAFQYVLKLDPSNVRARIQLAAQYSALGATGEARRALEELTRSNPRDPAGHYALAGFLVTQHELPAALREYDTFLQLAPGVYDQKTLDTVKSYVSSIRPRP